MDNETRIEFFQLPLPVYVKLYEGKYNPIINDLVQHGIDLNDKSLIVRFDAHTAEIGQENQLWFVFPDTAEFAAPFPILRNGMMVVSDHNGNQLGTITAVFQKDESGDREYPSCASCAHKCNKSGNSEENLMFREDCACPNVSETLKQILISLNTHSRRPDNLCLFCEKYQPE